MSFRDDQVAYYPRGKQPLVMYHIVSMNQDDQDPTLTAVVVKPTQPIIESVERQGVAVPLDYSQMLLFRVEHGRLSLVANAHPDGGDRRPPNAITQNYMDLIRCPK